VIFPYVPAVVFNEYANALSFVSMSVASIEPLAVAASSSVTLPVDVVDASIVVTSFVPVTVTVTSSDVVPFSLTTVNVSVTISPLFNA